MPEAPVNEHGNAATGEHEVGSAALRDLSVEPEPPTSGMDCLAEENLGNGVDLAAPSEVGSCGADPPLRHLHNLRRRTPAQLGQGVGRCAAANCSSRRAKVGYSATLRAQVRA